MKLRNEHMNCSLLGDGKTATMSRTGSKRNDNLKQRAWPFKAEIEPPIACDIPRSPVSRWLKRHRIPLLRTGGTDLDILLEAAYCHLECLLKTTTSVSNCCKAPWIC